MTLVQRINRWLWLLDLWRERTGISSRRLLLLSCAIVVGITLLVLSLRAYNSYERTLARGKAETERLVRIIADHTELTFLTVDLTLRRAAEKQYFNALFGNKLQDDLQNNLSQWVNQNPQIAAMLMTDEHGQITAIYRKQGYKTWLEGRESLERESYFRAQRSAADNELLFAEPQPNWINEGRFIVLSRRVTKIDGSFGGVIVAAVSSNYLTDFYDSLNVHGRTSLLLLYENKRVLLGTLEGGSGDLDFIRSQIENGLSQEAGKRIQLTMEPRKWFGDRRIIGYTYFPNLHVSLALIAHSRDVFADWWHDRRQDLLQFSLFLLFLGVLVSFTLTLLKQIRRVERSEKSAVMANQAKSDFLANMSHELRTPLNAIIGFSEMLDSGYFGTLNAKQKERIHDIHMCGTHLLELINDILEFSKGAAGKMELKEEKISLAPLVREATRFLTERARAQKVELAESLPQDLPRVLGDSRKLKQILINLLSNAVKFSHENGKVEVAARLLDDGTIVITVSDRGIGMAPEDIPKALSVFVQVHKNDGYEGTGLGLPLCKVFTELHGGKLKIESLKGVGTRVSVVLPANRVLREF